MLLFDKIKKSIVNNVDITETTIIPRITEKRTLLGDLMQNPEAFKIEAYLDKNGTEITIKVKPKEDSQNIEVVL